MCLCLPLAAPAAEPLPVVAGLAPIKYFIERIGGERVGVQALVPRGGDPHLFEPGPRVLATAARARLYLAIGMPFEHKWLPALRAHNPQLRTVSCAHAAPDSPALTADALDAVPVADAALDPHVWTSPRQAQHIAACIHGALVDRDPAAAADYDAGLAGLLVDLRALDADIHALFAAAGRRAFLVDHPAWGWFARDYGLEQLAIEHEGKAPRARQLAGVLDQARAAGLRTVFVQPQTADALARAAARELGGRLVEIDPLAGDYLANMRRVAAAIAGGGGGS